MGRYAVGDIFESDIVPLTSDAAGVPYLPELDAQGAGVGGGRPNGSGSDVERRRHLHELDRVAWSLPTPLPTSNRFASD